MSEAPVCSQITPLKPTGGTDVAPNIELGPD